MVETSLKIVSASEAGLKVSNIQSMQSIHVYGKSSQDSTMQFPLGFDKTKKSSGNYGNEMPLWRCDILWHCKK